MAKNIEIKKALRSGFDLALANLGTLILTGLMVMVVGGLWRLLFSTQGEHAMAYYFVSGLGHVVLGLYATIGFIKMGLMIHDGKKVSVRDFFHNFRLGLNLFIASVLVGICVFVGLFLLVVPGIIAMLGLSMYRFCVIDLTLDPVAALKRSWQMTLGAKWELLGFFLVMILVNCLGLICLGIGLILSIPTTFLATVYVYRSLLAQESAA